MAGGWRMRLGSIIPSWKRRNVIYRYPDLEDLDLNLLRYKPVALDHLQKVTRFTRRELQIMYRGFKQDCPSGIVGEDAFRDIYAHFFPQGDTAAYAKFIFNTFDKDRNGSLTFEQFVQNLSIVMRGSQQERLAWMFTLYDLNGDGVISRQELLQVCTAIYDLLGKHTEPFVTENVPRDHAERVFRKMDLDNDGVISKEEFFAVLSHDEVLLNAINCLDTVL